jgi:hypothetical protein
MKQPKYFSFARSFCWPPLGKQFYTHGLQTLTAAFVFARTPKCLAPSALDSKMGRKHRNWRVTVYYEGGNKLMKC